MPKQIGQFKTLGTVDDRTYYKTKYGYISRSKGSLTKQRINSEPNFARTRENMREFAQAAVAGSLFRKAFKSSTKKIRDGKMFTRLSQLMRKIILTDNTNDRGQRMVMNGDISMLMGFNFNEVSRLDEIVDREIEVTTLDNQVSMRIADIDPYNHIESPLGATHCKFFLVCAAMNFEENTFKEINVKSEDFDLEEQIAEVTISVDTTDLEAYHKFIAVGIEFSEEVNGRLYTLNDISYNALSIQHYVPAI